MVQSHIPVSSGTNRKAMTRSIINVNYLQIKNAIIKALPTALGRLTATLMTYWCYRRCLRFLYVVPHHAAVALEIEILARVNMFDMVL